MASSRPAQQRCENRDSGAGLNRDTCEGCAPAAQRRAPLASGATPSPSSERASQARSRTGYEGACGFLGLWQQPDRHRGTVRNSGAAVGDEPTPPQRRRRHAASPAVGHRPELPRRSWPRLSCTTTTRRPATCNTARSGRAARSWLITVTTTAKITAAQNPREPRIPVRRKHA